MTLVLSIKIAALLAATAYATYKLSGRFRKDWAERKAPKDGGSHPRSLKDAE